MPRARRAVPRAHLVPVVLAGLLVSAGCGSDDAGGDDRPAKLSDDTYERVVAQGVDPALVHTIELPGFELAEQSAGVLGDADYGAVYLPEEPPYTAEVHLEVRAGGYDASRCESDPLRGSAGGAATAVESCEAEADGWYRAGGDRHEFVVGRAGHHLVLSAPAEAVGREALTEAALGARPQGGTASSPAQPSSPVTRGDLPSTGDGAPMDPGGTSRPGG